MPPVRDEMVDSNGKPFDLAKVEQAALLLVDLHPLLAYDSARRIVETANDIACTPASQVEAGEAEREALDLRNIVLCAEDDVTVKHLRDLFGWSKIGAALAQSHGKP